MVQYPTNSKIFRGRKENVGCASNALDSGDLPPLNSHFDREFMDMALKRELSFHVPIEGGYL